MMGTLTRGKGRKRQHNSEEDPKAEVLRKIYLCGEITRDDISLLYNIGKPLCQGCRGNSKDSPNCFCGLIPSSGSKKQGIGIWKNIPDELENLGADPNDYLRGSLEQPAGLTNLGATCYANSILQCLFMNAAFRNRFLCAEPELLSQEPVLFQISRLFAHLHSGRKVAVEPTLFASTLELDSAVQQDSHEFFTLLLSLLEHSLSHSKNPWVKSVVQDLFRGSLSHVTCCSMCGQESVASAKVEDFYALELNVKGLNNLEESLDDYLSIEHLQGENQYFCDTCKQRTDATRCIKLRNLPPVLNLQLKRYVFLAKTTTKKKIMSKFSFPKSLNMGCRLNTQECDDLIYDLSAILIHKGAAVNSGHYVAHIKDQHTGIWWEFDDEQVSELGLHPFGPDRSAASQQQSDGVSGSGDQTTFSSSDAYMLMYSSRRPADIDPENLNSLISCGVPMNVEEKRILSTARFHLPEHLRVEVEESNRCFIKICEEYKLKRNEIWKRIDEHKDEVRRVLSEAPVDASQENYFWISSDWLRQWALTTSSLSIDNSNLLCDHHKVPPTNVPLMKRISAGSWFQLQNKYGGGPLLLDRDYCSDCIMEQAKLAVSATSYRDKRMAMKEAVEAVLGGSYTEGNMYFVSRSWLTQWLRRKIVDAPCEGDAGPTAALVCPHGHLQPEQATGAKRQLVPEYIWNYFLENAIQVEPDNPKGHKAFTLDSEVCPVCELELTEAVSLKDHLRETKLEHRQRHEQLASGKSIALIPGCRYYIVPSSWIAKWKSYLNTTGKNASTAEEPENLEQCIDSLLCRKHFQLLYRPPDIVRKKTELVQKVSNVDGLSIITGKDWDYFCEEWNVPKYKGISVVIETNDVEAKEVGNNTEMPVCLDGENDSDVDYRPKSPNKIFTLTTRPSVCEQCIEERESHELMRKLEYTNEDIHVHLVRGKEPPRSLLNAVNTANDAERRASKRCRRSTPNGSIVNLKVSGFTSIYQLKMMIWESLGVVKENQKLHKGALELSDELSTLADFNVFPGDTLWVADTEIHEYRDIMDELSGNDVGNDKAEEGFKGTLLSSTVPAKVF